MDRISDFDNLDLMVESNNINLIERELASAIGESSFQYDTESNLPAREDFHQESKFRNQNNGNNIPRHEGRNF